MNPGRLQHRISYQVRASLQDEYGNDQESPFTEQFVRWTEVKPSLGIETVAAARLEGRQPVDLVVRRDSKTLLIAADWQAVDQRDGTVYVLRSPPIDLKQDRGFLTMKAEVGVPG